MIEKWTLKIKSKSNQIKSNQIKSKSNPIKIKFKSNNNNLLHQTLNFKKSNQNNHKNLNQIKRAVDERVSLYEPMR